MCDRADERGWSSSRPCQSVDGFCQSADIDACGAGRARSWRWRCQLTDRKRPWTDMRVEVPLVRVPAGGFPFRASGSTRAQVRWRRPKRRAQDREPAGRLRTRMTLRAGRTVREGEAFLVRARCLRARERSNALKVVGSEREARRCTDAMLRCRQEGASGEPTQTKRLLSRMTRPLSLMRSRHYRRRASCPE